MQTADATLVGRACEERVREAVEALRAQGHSDKL